MEALTGLFILHIFNSAMSKNLQILTYMVYWLLVVKIIFRGETI